MPKNFSDYPPEFQQYDTQYKGQKERICYSLYDTVMYVSAASVQLFLFNIVRATLDLSNMEQAGSLPAPKAFFMRAVRFYVKQEPQSSARAAAGAVQVGAISNIKLLTNTGVLQLTIGSKLYMQTPLWKIPSGGGAFGGLASDGDVADPGEVQDWAVCGYPHVRNALTLAVPIFLGPGVNFRVELTWPAAVALAGGNTPISVVFDGDLVRQVQ